MGSSDTKSASPSLQPERAATGIPGLDDILGGGFPKTRVYLVEGDPGSGKTTMALQFLLEGLKQGESGLYVTLSETKDELLAVAESHDWNLDHLAIHELSFPEDKLTPGAYYTFFHPSEVELSGTTKSVLAEVERVKPVRVVFDSLSEMRLLARDPLKYRRQILGLKQFFIGRACTVLLLDDRTAPDGDLQLQSLAHGVVMLEQLSPLYGAERRRLRVIKMRGVKFRGGYHDFTIKKGGLEVYPRLISAEHPKNHVSVTRESTSTGLKEMDQILGGGLNRGTSTLIMGPAGAGKSALASQYAYAAALRGEKSVIFTFDEGVATLFDRAESLGCELRKHADSGLVNVQQVDPAELSPGEFVHRVREAVQKDNVSVVVIDSLNGYLNSMPEESFLVIQMHELLSFLNQKGVVTILVVAQHGLLGTTMQAPVDVSYLADTVIILRYFEANGFVRKAVSVLKKRYGAHEDSIREYIVSSKGLRVGDPLTGYHGVLTGVPEILPSLREQSATP
ncbi:MAG TPA: ATPase domain-containing protein [Oligoflexus sp.]|uniref:ATPase domain-containing protein n=1 Tax=Oligoflexus sp. TaxID=1971216 RepID=UPI002D7365F0|nr:ATPase domain-containing protein [Oligoflexus sp.]HYX39574.1 ATPase domain-containing protein [Oligoflexus sp.]